MVSKCLNPHCTAEFRYFGDGKLFEFTPDSAGESSQLYWLCDACQNSYTLERDGDGGIQMIAKDGSSQSQIRLDRAS